MSTCNVCANECAIAYEIYHNEQSYTFDCFECAIYKLAPACKCCGCIVIGHGIELNKQFYCSAHCLHSSSSVEPIKVL